MSEKKIVVPEGMLEAAHQLLRKLNVYPHPDSNESRALRGEALHVLEAALLWLSENPILPSVECANKLWSLAHSLPMPPNTGHAEINILMLWQRRMFLAPEPEVPDEVKDMLVEEYISRWRGEEVNEKVIEAFRRGQKSEKR